MQTSNQQGLQTLRATVRAATEASQTACTEQERWDALKALADAITAHSEAEVRNPELVAELRAKALATRNATGEAYVAAISGSGTWEAYVEASRHEAVAFAALASAGLTLHEVPAADAERSSDSVDYVEHEVHHGAVNVPRPRPRLFGGGHPALPLDAVAAAIQRAEHGEIVQVPDWIPSSVLELMLSGDSYERVVLRQDDEFELYVYAASGWVPMLDRKATHAKDAEPVGTVDYSHAYDMHCVNVAGAYDEDTDTDLSTWARYAEQSEAIEYLWDNRHNTR